MLVPKAIAPAGTGKEPPLSNVCCPTKSDAYGGLRLRLDLTKANRPTTGEPRPSQRNLNSAPLP
ncbi:MAG: hypothetical protein ACIWVG_29245 [Gloeotrichia echinulata HAB0833]